MKNRSGTYGKIRETLPLVEDPAELCGEGGGEITFDNTRDEKGGIEMKEMMDRWGRKMGGLRDVFIFMVIILFAFFVKGALAQPLAIVSTTPNNNSFNNPINTIIRVQFNKTMDTNASWIDVEDEYENEVGGSVNWSQTSVPNDTLRFVPTQAMKPATHYSVEGIGQKAGGGESVEIEINFITKHSTADTTPPTVQMVYPYDEMKGVQTGSSIYIKFSEAMNPPSVTAAGNIILTGPGINGTGDYVVAYSFEEGFVAIKKKTPFTALSIYDVAIKTDLKDLRGNWLKNQYQWSFKTGDADTMPPFVTQRIPAIDDDRVNIHPQFHVLFSEEMDEATLSATNISLHDNNSLTDVPIQVLWTEERYVTFGPQSDLVNDHNYTVTIGTGVKDLAGNGLSNPDSWSFTVASLGEDSDPVIFVGPSNQEQLGIRWPGETTVELVLGAWDDKTDPLDVAATSPPSYNWTLTKPLGEFEYEYKSTFDEGLTSGFHTLTFTIKDSATPQNIVTFKNDIFIFDSYPILSSPSNGDVGVSTTPTFQWSYVGSLRPFVYTARVWDGPDPGTAQVVWQGWMVDNGSETYSLYIPSDKPLAPNTTYYWGIEGKNYDENGSTHSEVRYFTTGGTPPPVPEFSWVMVRSDDQPTGKLWNIGAKVIGPSPFDIRELKVTGPGGFKYIFIEDNIIQSELDGLFFWKSLTYALPNGTYTFSVTDLMGRTVARNITFTSVSVPVPRVDSMTLTPSDNTYVGTTTPTFSWGNVGPGDYYYRIQVFDWNYQEASIYTSSYVQSTETTISFTLPSGRLLSNTAYRWRVEVFDSSKQNRSVSNTLSFSTWDDFGPTEFDWGILWSDNNYYGRQRKSLNARVKGTIPTDLEYLTLSGPETYLHNFSQAEIRWSVSLGNIYAFGEPGFPADGDYVFSLRDDDGNEDTYSKNQTSIEIPIVGQGTLSPVNNAYLNTFTPTFLWSPVEGTPRYYRISINDWMEKYTIYQSPRSTSLSFIIPNGVLKSQRSYKWRVEVFDDQDGLVADNRSSTGWNCFTIISQPLPPCECDLNHDGRCDMLDWLLFGQDWGRTDCLMPGVNCECDLNHDGRCDMLDWLLFGQDWGRTNCPIP